MRKNFLWCVGVFVFLFLSGSVITEGRDEKKAAPGMKATELINTMIGEKWKERKITPAAMADDAEFLRRVTLDLVGTVPTPDQILAFLRDPSPNKREKKIDELMDSHGFAEHWEDYWTNLLIGRQMKGRYREGKKTFEAWLTDSIQKNKPYDQFVKELLTADGRNDENGATNYLLAQIVKGERSPEFIAGNVTRTFMGVRMQCAQCHNHPYEKWTQEDFYGMTAYFARVTARPIREEMMEDMKDMKEKNAKRDEKMDVKKDEKDAKDDKKDDKDKEKKKKKQQAPRFFELMDIRRGEARIPVAGKGKDQGKMVEPTFITGEKMSNPRQGERRDEFVRLLISPENPFFAKAIVNRMWSVFMGRGFVEPIDDFRESNPPTHPELLDALARDFVDHGYDVKYLIRSIANSKPYQLSSRASTGNEDTRAFYAQADLRPLSPEQLFYALMQVTGAEDLIRKRARGKYQEAKERLIQGIAFLFDNDEMEESTDFEGTISQALLMMNGQVTTEGVRSNADNQLTEVMKKTKNPGERIDWIFLTVLSRLPGESEKARYLEFVRRNKGEDVAYQDIFWVLLNTTEFIFNH